MAITKPPVLPAWAESGDKVTPSNAEIQVGWPLSSIPPSRQRFNWLLNFLANGIRYFSRRGLPDYDAAETYMTGDRIIGDDGKTYRSLIDNNTAQTPSTSPTKWEEWAPTLSRFAALIQGQTYTAFTTAGAAPNFTLTPSPAIAAYAAGQRFRVKFHAAGTGSDVLNVSALGNKSLKQYDSTGAKVAAVIAASQLADVEYDGVDMIIMDPLPPTVSVKQIQTVTASVAANALTVGLNPTNLDFRSSALSSGAVNTRSVSSALSLTIPSGATLGTVSGVASRILILAIDNAGTVELAVYNAAGAANLDETGVISTTAISAAANALTVYSQTARTNVPYRIAGYVDSTQTAAGTWASAPTAIQGIGGQALAAMSSLGYGQSWQSVARTAGTTYYNTTGKPIVAVIQGGTTMGGSITVGGQMVARIDTGNPTPSQGSCNAIVPPGAAYVYGGSNWTAYELR